MAIQKISEEEFYKYNVYKHPSGNLLGEEVAWFSETDASLIALLLKDKIDKDYAYVILSNEEGDEYRAMEVEASLDTKQAAENKLRKKIGELVVKDQFRDKIYEQDQSLIQSEKLIITDINEEVKKYFKKHPEKLYELHPRKFEELIASIFEDMGMDVELTKATRDGGKDIIAVMKNALTNMVLFVECKRYAPDFKVDVGIIREAAGVHSFRNPEKSIIVTTSFFTKDAVEEAKLLHGKMLLKDYNDLKGWLGNY
ncbi:restriction endonuclease [Flavobacterium sp. B183]|uniref:restriction endonuclease n=1 Tax=Flavobacterium sp. B183 TaxID=907046 RepID=UPI00201F5F38|nr:restriction endonuclease [Flavobacterium sp. B183]URC11546.1 restriction endonuclease [Flavobacterium sp. B183]